MEASATTDRAAARSASANRKALTIGLVNPNGEEKVVNVDLLGVKPAGKATFWTIAGDDPKAFNTVDAQPIAVDLHEVAGVEDAILVRARQIRIGTVTEKDD